MALLNLKGLCIMNPSEMMFTAALNLVILEYEYYNFTLTAPETVYFGIDGAFTSKVLAAGTYGCLGSAFDNVDPAPGASKVCCAYR
jgi:hypothetical protein